MFYHQPQINAMGVKSCNTDARKTSKPLPLKPCWWLISRSSECDDKPVTQLAAPCPPGRGPSPLVRVSAAICAASEPNPKPLLSLPLSCYHWFH